MFKLHGELLVVNLIFFSESNAGIIMFFLMLFIDRDFCSGEQCGPWASCLVITLFKLINLCQYTFFQCQMHDGLLPPPPCKQSSRGVCRNPVGQFKSNFAKTILG